jgi:hypothetical protein
MAGKQLAIRDGEPSGESTNRKMVNVLRVFSPYYSASLSVHWPMSLLRSVVYVAIKEYPTRRPASFFNSEQDSN